MTTTPPATRTSQVALIGNPNTGKSTLFNILAGMNTRTGNYPGVTVEKKIGRVTWEGQQIDLIDLPGTYSLSPRTPDEMVSVDVLMGHAPSIGEIDAVICIADATNLERNLYLVSQILDMGIPAILVLNMWDSLKKRSEEFNLAELQSRLGIPVIPAVARKGTGTKEIKQALAELLKAKPKPKRLNVFPAPFNEAMEKVRQRLTESGVDIFEDYEVERLILDKDGSVEKRCLKKTGPEFAQFLTGIRENLKEQNCTVPRIESECRYQWAKSIMAGLFVVDEDVKPRSASDHIDRVLTHNILGLVVFFALMFLIIQTIITWAEPVMGWCEYGQETAAGWVEAGIGPGPLRSLLVDGVIAGVGGVLIFLPQIVFLFLFISIMEDTGYMARAALMMDRFMRLFGLSGKSFLPLMSSFACAIPGIMAARVVENQRDRIVTMLIAPLMSCTARFPVYWLLTMTFVPSVVLFQIPMPVLAEGGYWDFTLPALVIFLMHLVGAVVAIPVAFLLKKTAFKGEAPPFVMELPDYKWPSIRNVSFRVYDRAKAFVVRAGTLIFAATLVIWAAGYFPGDHTEQHAIETELETLDEEADADRIATLEARNKHLSATLIETSFLGQAGHVIEPVVKPLGWDWKIGVGVVASFPAREVIIATMGTIYSLGGEVDEEDDGLRDALHESKWPDGTKVFNVPVALSIMVFFALCAQCVSTLMVIRRETNSWKWAAFSFSYMTILAYIAAFVVYQVGMLFVA
ncbi:Ferrous iron transport protein B [Polystyrenella longa]|uniref:Ferrous iron transport protein B n=1 Tax=Polystyrenella longa TaxID=2528007 RepID=A0A518CKU2_9PLAN|nr:ferrous iron transport protein B [Polystyrenella longa]QDU79850.1 Ferrous iron transport protein B [Polystyrenella longa]